MEKKLSEVVRGVFSFLENGNDCIGCGSRCGSVPICKSCREKLLSFTPIYAEHRCKICGRDLLSSRNICISCRKAPILVHTDGVYPLHSYRLWKKNLLFVWKMQGMRSLSPVFASMILKGLEQLSKTIGIKTLLPVVPVPPRPGKIRKTGWDQIDELCSYLRLSGCIILPLLERKISGQQKHLNRNRRLQTIGKSYKIKSSSATVKILRKNGLALPPSVVILDDIITTGATIESCARVLKEFGIQKVFAFSLFIAD